jgi:hypothetical protein
MCSVFNSHNPILGDPKISETYLWMLTMCNDDMPQHGLDDMEGAQVTFLQSVLLAEAFPTLSKKVANFFVCDTAHLP